jgi:hypothetical protein
VIRTFPSTDNQNRLPATAANKSNGDDPHTNFLTLIIGKHAVVLQEVRLQQGVKELPQVGIF